MLAHEVLDQHYHDLTFGAQSCPAHQMEIFAQEFEPASFFLWLDLRSLDHESTKIGPNFNKLSYQKMVLL